MSIETGAPRRRVTISDLAARLGMPKGTVSRALNDYADISDRTKKRVAAAAAEIGYRPLSHAQAIKTGRASALGLVLDVAEDGTHRPFLTDFLDGVSQAASAENWSVTIATASEPSGVVDAMRRLLDERKADGFILPRTRRIDPRVAFLRSRKAPFVLYGRIEDAAADCAWHDIDSAGAMRDATLRLAAFGHRRIAFLNYDAAYMLSALRLEGFEAGMAAAGLPVDRALILSGVVTQADGAAAGAQLLDLDEPPTAVVCAVDRAALGLYRAAADRGLEIGRDLSVIGYDGAVEGAFADPPLTTFAVDLRAAGAALANTLIHVIRGADPTALRSLAPAQLVRRSSDGAPAAQETKKKNQNKTDLGGSDGELENSADALRGGGARRVDVDGRGATALLDD